MNIKPDLSLIIAVYNKPDFLEKVFISLCNQTFKQFEVIVADDGSGPEIARFVDLFQGSFSHPIRHVWHPDQGFRKTIIANEAVAQAAADYLVFIDGDCILHHRFLEQHTARRWPGRVLAGRRVMLDREITSRMSAGDIAAMAIERPAYWWNHCSQGQRKHGFCMPALFHVENALKQRRWIIGSNFSVHRSDFEAVNGYDETITGRGLEDTNLTARFRLQGIRIMSITREALQYHLFHDSGPVPHNKAAFDRLGNPAKAWADSGLDQHTRKK